MRRVLVLCVLAVAALCAASVAADDDIIFGEDPRRPVDAKDPDLQCASCKAVITEAKKALLAKGKKKLQDEVEVTSVLRGICKQDNFMVYDFIPPKMLSGCEEFIGSNDDLVEDYFVSGKAAAGEDIAKYCKDVVKVCDGKEHLRKKKGFQGPMPGQKKEEPKKKSKKSSKKSSKAKKAANKKKGSAKKAEL